MDIWIYGMQSLSETNAKRNELITTTRNFKYKKPKKAVDVSVKAFIYALETVKTEKAFEWLDKAYNRHDSETKWKNTSPRLKIIHNYKRYDDLFVTMKLSEL